MTIVRNKAIVFPIFLLMLFGLVNMANASEVTGTLSSDGSANTSQGTVSRESDTRQGSTVSSEQQGSAQSSGQLQGSVVQGRDESAAASLADASSSSTVMWVLSLGGLALVALAFFLWRRGVV